MSLRIGLGFDSHPLEPGRRCVLGGVEIQHPSGPAGHSDGDAVLHALADAILGAAGLEDLGTLFPDRDERFAGVDSRELLTRVVGLARGAGYSVVNVDLVLVADAPRIAPHREAMRRVIAETLGIDASRVGVKGKTTEGMGVREGVGVAVHAVCLLETGEG